MSALLGYEQVGLIVMTGLFSAPHCTIMCGGIVSAVSLHAKIPAHQSVLLYNVGRVFSYSLLGAVMGAIGSFINVAGKLAGLQGLASIVGGLFVLLWLWRRFQLPFLHRFSALLHKRLASGRAASERRDRLQTIATGIAFGFLPCGLTYAMQMTAAATGSAAGGAAVMALFGAATLPALAAAASVAALANKRWRRLMRKAGVVTAVAVGLLSIMRGLVASGVVASINPWLW
jgi:sulfite exporter TauE/SafE